MAGTVGLESRKLVHDWPIFRRDRRLQYGGSEATHDGLARQARPRQSGLSAAELCIQHRPNDAFRWLRETQDPLGRPAAVPVADERIERRQSGFSQLLA